MNKKEFIKLLEQKLQILDESELKDIINEYKDIIDEKVKHGKTEEEAVTEFGSVDELAKEILKAYKINPKYGEMKDQVRETLDNCETLIKKGARKLSTFTKEVIEDIKDDKETLSIEMIFEILIKFVIMLVIFAVLRLPFELVSSLGESILDIAFFPLDKILIVFWELAVFILYVVSCLLIFMSMFREYFKSTTNVKKESVKTKKREEKIVESNEISEVKKEVGYTEKNSGGSLTRTISILSKIFITIFILIPLMFMNIGLFISLGVAVYYLIIGIDTIGLIVLLIGVGIITNYLQEIFYNIAYRARRVYFFPFVIGTVLSVVGGLLIFNTAINFEYYDKLPTNDLKTETKMYYLKVDKQTELDNYNSEITYKINEELANGDIIVKVDYYSDLIQVDKNTYFTEGETMDYINIASDYINYRKTNIKLYNMFIDNLKENEVYNYGLLYQLNVEVSANAETMNLLK